jgi:hypothetical protein
MDRTMCFPHGILREFELSSKKLIARSGCCPRRPGKVGVFSFKLRGPRAVGPGHNARKHPLAYKTGEWEIYIFFRRYPRGVATGT